MTKCIFFYVVLLLFLQSCFTKNFVYKKRQIDLLPQSISIDSIRIFSPVFSKHKILGSKIEYSIGVPVKSEELFENHILFLLDSLKINGTKPFSQSSCLTNKIHQENWYDNKWNLANSYTCLKIDSNYYTILLYSMLEISELGGTTTDNLNSEIQSLIKVFFKNRIVYTRNYRYSKRLTNKEQKDWGEKWGYYPFFKDDQIKHVVQKITEDLFKRIKSK